MATKSTDNKPPLNSLEEKNDEKLEKKLTVLESHGYSIGKTIGAGSYATVKVCYIVNNLMKINKYKTYNKN